MFRLAVKVGGGPNGEGRYVEMDFDRAVGGTCGASSCAPCRRANGQDVVITHKDRTNKDEEDPKKRKGRGNRS